MKTTFGTYAVRLWRWCRPIAIIVLVLTSFRSAVADWNDVPTGSMKPTILEGDRILVNKLAYDLKLPYTNWHLIEWGQPRRSDIVILYSPVDGTRLVKRVVAVPGDRIEMRSNRLFINGEAASYAPLEQDTIDQIDKDQQPSYQFATEDIAGQAHPVMVTPGRRSPHSFGPITVPQGQFFVMGDNRDASADSRVFGFVDRELIVGRSTRVALSVDPDNHYLPRWDRFFRPLP